MDIGDRVYVWDEKKHLPLGWGKIIAIAERVSDARQTPCIKLEKTGEKIWGDRCGWMFERKAIEIGAHLFRDVTGGNLDER